MAFLMDQAVRLLREKWTSPQLLAEELYSMFAADTPFTIDGPVTINNPGNLPGITINNGGLGDQAFQFNKTPSPIDFPGFSFPPGDSGIPGLPSEPGLPSLPGENPPSFGYTTQITLQQDGNTYITEGPSDQPLPPASPVGGGGGGGAAPVYGLISSGSGDSYEVQVYNSAGEFSGKTISVRQLQIDPGATIPAGTAVICYLTGVDTFGNGIFVMQHPVWV